MKEIGKSIIFSLNRLLFFLCNIFRNNIQCEGGIRLLKVRLAIARSANLKISSSVVLMNSEIVAGNGSKVEIGIGCVIRNVKIALGENSALILSPGVIMDYRTVNLNSIWINTGQVFIGERANLNCQISMRFGARLNIGKHAGIGFGTEIVCDELIEIGDYCLISSEVDIYDTNSHSVDSLQRRIRMIASYPAGCFEIEKPETSPVKIGTDTWIGKRSMIMKGTSIGERCIVGMGTQVTAGIYEPDTIIVNNKARQIVK